MRRRPRDWWKLRTEAVRWATASQSTDSPSLNEPLRRTVKKSHIAGFIYLMFARSALIVLLRFAVNEAGFLKVLSLEAPYTHRRLSKSEMTSLSARAPRLRSTVWERKPVEHSVTDIKSIPQRQLNLVPVCVVGK